jgi:hypothetical protein
MDKWIGGLVDGWLTDERGGFVQLSIYPSTQQSI